MQTSSQPHPPTVPPQASAAPVSITVAGADGAAQTLTIPRTREQIEELVGQRAELSDQLLSAADRRANLSDQLRSAPDGVSRAGLEARLGVLDQRIIQIETDIASTERQLSSAPAELMAGADGGSQPGMMHEDDVLAMGAFNFLVLIPLLLFFARRRWKRAAAPARGQMSGEIGERLERLEHAVGAIAIEIERVSEGQRFVTKLLSESATPVGAANRISERVESKR
ncbi:MAG: hypothetical protein H0U13_03955 [Gemmatimonadaceae bacterium]|nr:hypothetical protein [Gemmatimonadaceae bacterium]